MMKRIFLAAAMLLALLLLLCAFASAADLLPAFSGTETEVTGMDFGTAKTVPAQTQTYTFTSEELAGVSNGDLIVFKFVVKAPTACTPLDISVKGAEGVSPALKWFVPVQWTRITMPIVAKDLESITFTPDGSILLAEASYENRGDADISTTNLEEGEYLLEDFQHTLISDSGIGVGKSKDMMKHGDYIYTLSTADGGSLTVVDAHDLDHPQIRGKVGNLGAAVRQICMCASGTDVILTSRQNGAYIVDVSDPDAPRVRSTYNSIEMATGLSVSGDLAFIANRQNGVEIVDISDLDHPRHIANVRSGEAQGCLASGNILFCGLWDYCTVNMYDISDLNNVRLLGIAQLNGKGDGMTVHTVGGRKYLYAATGQHTTKVASSSKLTDLRFGNGNGLDIFDITDPTHPKWLSTTRIDGRFYHASNDNWEVLVSEKNGQVYAYLANTFNGVYTFNVTDPAAPIRLEHTELKFPKGSPYYSVITDANRPVVFPYDQNVATNSAVAGLAVEDGVMYLAGFHSDVHIYRDGLSVYDAVVPPACDTVPVAHSSYYDFDGAGLQGYKAVANGQQYFTVEPHGDNLFVACGSAGILVMDKELNTLAQYPTGGICFDLAIRGDTLYAAEGDNGVTAYTINGTTLTELWNHVPEHGVCRSVEYSATGKFLLLQTGANYFDLLSTETLKRVAYSKGSAQAYHRNLLTFGDRRYLGGWVNGYQEFWYDCGENDSLAAPKLIRTINPTKNSMMGGGTQYGDRMTAMTSNGYVLYDPLASGTTITDPTIRASTAFTGNHIIESGVMIASDRVYGHLYLIDVSDIGSPEVMQAIDLPGNPDLARIVNGAVYVPLGYQGIMKFDLMPFLAQSGYKPKNDAEAVAAGYSWSYTTEEGETTYYRDLTGDNGAYTQGLAKDTDATREHAGVLKLLQDYTITAEMPENTNALISNPAKAFNLDFNGHKITNSLATRTGAYFLYYNATSGSYTAKVHFFSSADTPGEYDHSAYTDSATRMMIGAGFGNISANIKMDVTVENLIASSGNMPIINMESTDNRLVLRGCDFTTAKKQYAAVVVGTPNCTGEGGAVPCRADVTVEDCTLRSGFCGLELVDYVYINSANKTNYYTTDFRYALTLLGTNTFTCQPASRAAATHGVLIELHDGGAETTMYDPKDVAQTEDGKALTWSEPVTADGMTSFTVTSKEAAKRGDVNGDNVISTKDITALRRALAGGYGITFADAAADVNGDGVVNTKDITTLRRYLAGGYGIVLDNATARIPAP